MMKDYIGNVRKREKQLNKHTQSTLESAHWPIIVMLKCQSYPKADAARQAI